MVFKTLEGLLLAFFEPFETLKNSCYFNQQVGKQKICNYYTDKPEGRLRVQVQLRVRLGIISNTTSIIRPFLPQREDDDCMDFYRAFMLALLTSWWNLGDLKADKDTWEGAFLQFEASTSQKARNVMAGIQYYYDCASATHCKEDLMDGQGLEWNDNAHVDVEQAKSESSGQQVGNAVELLVKMMSNL